MDKTNLEIICKIQRLIINLSYNKAAELASIQLINAENPTILNLRAEALLNLNNLNSAISDCETVKRLNNEDWEPYYRLGVALFRKGEYDSACAELKLALKKVGNAKELKNIV